MIILLKTFIVVITKEMHAHSKKKKSQNETTENGNNHT